MSIEPLIGGDHGKGSFRTIIKINAIFISGRNITRIFRLAHFQFKRYNGEILWNIAMPPIWFRLNNICARRFIGWTHEVKTQFIILSHGCTIPPPREKNMQFIQAACFCHWRPIFICHCTCK